MPRHGETLALHTLKKSFRQERAESYALVILVKVHYEFAYAFHSTERATEHHRNAHKVTLINGEEENASAQSGNPSFQARPVVRWNAEAQRFPIAALEHYEHIVEVGGFELANSNLSAVFELTMQNWSRTGLSLHSNNLDSMIPTTLQYAHLERRNSKTPSFVEVNDTASPIRTSSPGLEIRPMTCSPLRLIMATV